MYTDTVLSFFQNATLRGSLESPDAVGRAGTPGCGPFMVLELRGSVARIAEARFSTYGCPAATACGQWVSSWVAGKSAEAARLLEAGDLERILGGLPLGKSHCATLAVDSLRMALAAMPAERGIEQ